MNIQIFLCSVAFHFFAMNLSAEIAPRVIIHFDVNRTIMAEDPAGGKSVEDVLLHALAEEYTDSWDSSLTQAISYAEYVKTYLLPGNKHDAELKKMRNKKISEFMEFLERNNHPLYQQVHHRFTLLTQKLTEHGRMVFNSFYLLLHYFKQHEISYVIVLRTFGNDIDRVVDEIHHYISPAFFSWRGVFRNGAIELTSLTTGENIQLATTQELYEFLKTHGNIALQDDWQTWNAHGECQEFGKLFPVDVHDTRTLSLFADDNAHPKDGILNPRHPATDEVLDVEQLICIKHICVVDTLKAIEDDAYFVSWVHEMLHPKEKIA